MSHMPCGLFSVLVLLERTLQEIEDEFGPIRCFLIEFCEKLLATQLKVFLSGDPS